MKPKYLAVIAAITSVACHHAIRTRPASVESAEAMPQYPRMLHAANLAGVVELAVPISAEGKPDGPLGTIESTHDLFLLSVRRAVRTWRFRPAQTGEARHADTLRIRFVFALDSSSRCGPAEVTRRLGEPGPVGVADAAPVAVFDGATLRGSVTVCRTPRMRVISH